MGKDITEQDVLPGLDRDGVRAWFADNVGSTRGLSFTLVANGLSNLTYLVTGGDGRRWILRRPPVHVTHAGAHDVGREFRIMSSLKDRDVPVPSMVGSCSDSNVTGAPFYVMDFVDGVVMDGTEAIDSLDDVARERFVVELGSTLARIHAVDLTDVGLGDFIKPHPLVRRQLRRWRHQLLEGTGSTVALLLDLHDRLAADAPHSDRPVLVHGDFRPGNVIVAADGSIAAVLDWELAAAGDGLVDLGWLACRWSDGVGWSPEPYLTRPGLTDLLKAYGAAGGLRVENLAYYQAFSLWRLACIAVGVYARYASGAMGEPPEPLDVLKQKPQQLADMARTLLG